MPTAEARFWRTRRKSSRFGRPPRPAVSSEEVTTTIDRGLQDALAEGIRSTVAEAVPDLWKDLTEEGRGAFTRNLVEAWSRPPEDRQPAIRDVLRTWFEARALLYAPADDEPFTEEEQAEVEAAWKRLNRGEGIPL